MEMHLEISLKIEKNGKYFELKKWKSRNDSKVVRISKQLPPAHSSMIIITLKNNSWLNGFINTLSNNFLTHNTFINSCVYKVLLKRYW